ncbi:hypothetical protein BDP55DRAFT_634713 [Colletotrichum godetiae]|uniref:Uncharacterized protein n=1 Tax=Colletotrichum godetiae TaxID=1209918 RepID=A0AAJ0AF15_9PEZI|nr:uncharacterized protein BDP55DRAFT_634713 [Colletotrichum godetiae]KAK1672701.1 hypothetical protein BDP55DRAFT_634713 [Colletotrichum godetiae]
MGRLNHHHKGSNNSRSSHKRQSRLGHHNSEQASRQFLKLLPRFQKRPKHRLSSTHIRVEYDNSGNEGDELPVFPYGPHVVPKAPEVASLASYIVPNFPRDE